ncbi:MAG: hypothetical protein HQL55_02410 [Magnetococcales bacterium]|nr:hypothetical protein [Magnetococcales bacterium]
MTGKAARVGLLLLCSLSISWAWGERREELLSQLLNIQQEGLQAKGRVTVRSLSPPHVEIQLDEATGEGPRLVRLLSRWMQLPPEMSQDFPIKQMTLHQTLMIYKAGGWTMESQRLSIPEGEFKNLSYAKSPEGTWQLSVRQADLQRIPAWPGVPQLGEVHGERLSASGDEKSLRWELKSWRGGGMQLEQGSGSYNGSAPTPLLPWSGRANKVVVDLAPLWSWTSELPQVVKFRQDISHMLGVDTLRPSGRLLLQNPDFQGGYEPVRQQVGDLKGKGALSLADEGITLLAAGAGKEEKIRITTLKGQLRGEGEGLGLEQARLFLTSGGGTGQLTGTFSSRLEKSRFDSTFDALMLAGWQLDGQLGWQPGSKKPLQLTLNGPKGQSVVMVGESTPWSWQKMAGIDFNLSRLEVKGIPKGENTLLKEIPLFRQSVPLRIRARQATFDRKVVADYQLTSR